MINNGGGVRVQAGTYLKLDASNAAGESYIQDGDAHLLIAATGKLNASGKVQIDGGKVEFQVVSGSISVALQSAGLIFDNVNPTELKLTDSVAGTNGTVSVIGSVTLASNTTTRMSFSKANGTADLLDVQGALTLDGTLSLDGDAKPNAGAGFNFFDSFGLVPTINGAFDSIMDNVMGNPAGAVVNHSQNLKYYRVTW